MTETPLVQVSRKAHQVTMLCCSGSYYGECIKRKNNMRAYMRSNDKSVLVCQYDCLKLAGSGEDGVMAESLPRWVWPARYRRPVTDQQLLSIPSV